MFNVQLQEHLDSVLATPQTADLEYARNVGREQPQRAWILSDRDCWYPNPFYTGPKVRHPEDDGYDDVYDDEPGSVEAPMLLDDPFAGQYLGGAHTSDPLGGEDFSGGRF